MAQTQFDRQFEEAVGVALSAAGRFLSGARQDGEPQAPGGMPPWQKALLRICVLGWGGWAAWTWWWLGLHDRVIWWSAAAAGVLVPTMVVVNLRGRAQRRHMRTLVTPLAMALRQVLPEWDDDKRRRAVTIPLDRSFVRIQLPDGWHGQDGNKDNLRELVASRMGGKWRAEWNLQNYPFNVVFLPYTPKPTPEPPERVDFFSPSIQDAIARCAPGQIVLGVDEHQRAFVKSMTGETAMWALSVGSGGGKSSLLQMVIAQLVRQGATVVACDVKMSSLICYEGVQGIHLYTDPGQIGDMRAAISWVAEEVASRNYLKKQDPTRNFQRLTLILEEGNEFGDASKEWWTENKEKEDPARDPMWGDVASVMRMGRHVNVTIIAVFQDLREAAVGNRGLRNMFRFIMMGNFNANQWKMIVNTSPVPESVDRAGRILAIEGNRRVWIQVPYADPDAFRDHAQQLRREIGYSTLDLFGGAPRRSEERLPSLLQKSTPIGPPGKSLSKATADADVDQDAVLAPTRVLPPSRQALAGPVEVPEPLHEATVPAPPDAGDAHSEGAQEVELLTLAEIARRMAEDDQVPVPVKPGLMRAHKHRRPDFPAGIEEGPRELYTYHAVLDYYRRNPPQSSS